jgi:stress response protein YsnF
LLGIEVSIEPLTELRDAKLSWYVGLDTDATEIGDRLWHGEALDEETNGRVRGIYRLTFADPALMLEEVGREPVYLIMAMSPQKLVRLKPQNLLTGLPIRHLEAAT